MWRNENPLSPVSATRSGAIELLAHERVERVVERGAVAGRDRAATASRQNSLPTTDAAPIACGSATARRSSARREQRLDRRRDRDPSRRRPLPSSASICSTKSGLPSARSTSCVAAASPRPPRQQVVDQRARCRRRRAARARSSARSARPAPPTPGAARAAPRARGRRAAAARPRGLGQVLDQVEQRRLGPVHVLEDEHERPLAASASKKPPDRPREVAPGSTASARPAACSTRSAIAAACGSPASSSLDRRRAAPRRRPPRARSRPAAGT